MSPISLAPSLDRGQTAVAFAGGVWLPAPKRVDGRPVTPG